MICTRPNRPHQNKRNDLLLRIEHMRWQNRSQHVSIDLAKVSVPIEDGTNMPLVDQHFHAQSCPSWTCTFVPTQVLQTTHK
jgi:hypothetical protein